MAGPPLMTTRTTAVASPVRAADLAVESQASLAPVAAAAAAAMITRTAMATGPGSPAPPAPGPQAVASLARVADLAVDLTAAPGLQAATTTVTVATVTVTVDGADGANGNPRAPGPQAVASQARATDLTMASLARAEDMTAASLARAEGMTATAASLVRAAGPHPAMTTATAMATGTAMVAGDLLLVGEATAAGTPLPAPGRQVVASQARVAHPPVAPGPQPATTMAGWEAGAHLDGPPQAQAGHRRAVQARAERAVEVQASLARVVGNRCHHQQHYWEVNAWPTCFTLFDALR